ncbi:MBL fold metallo-hydrolase [Thermogemmatispora sp.]|uniref:MBL fold metallo-hydrolase n=1 Tax=Thermogemmatispora sp. TaxID=1968838 RepID=UPI00263700E3|nr:MBL fold metallo-hydrolase [Thermogemmatispora sp.]
MSSHFAMEISWLGHSCFQLRGKQVTLITDPFAPQTEVAPQQKEPLRLGKVSASIVTISHEHPNHNYVRAVQGNPRIVRGPGEYEISDVLITGVASYHDNRRGRERGRNTIYVIHIDGIVVCHLGDLGHTLQEEQLEEVADADILLVPIGGEHTLNASQAAEVISQVVPRIVIPMHYYPLAADGSQSLPDALVTFCREMGVEAINPQPRLVISQSNLPTETQVVILSCRSLS